MLILANLLQPFFDHEKIEIHERSYLIKVIGLVKDRCHLLADFITQSSFFFTSPTTIDTAAILPKWEEKKLAFFTALAQSLKEMSGKPLAADLEVNFKALAASHEIKPGDLLLPLRIMLVGGKFGPGVFDIIEAIEIPDTIARIEHSLQLLSGK